MGNVKVVPCQGKRGRTYRAYRPGVNVNKLKDDMWTEKQVPYDGASRRKILGLFMKLSQDYPDTIVLIKRKYLDYQQIV